MSKGFQLVLAAGTIAPEFSLIDHTGEQFVLSEALKESPVALVFFPLAFSGICHGELCELRDNIDLFADAKVRLCGVSVDSIHSLRTWAEQQHYDFSLLSDFWPHGEVAKLYDAFVPERGIANRSTVIIGQSGEIVASFETQPGEARQFTQYRAALAQL